MVRRTKISVLLETTHPDLGAVVGAMRRVACRIPRLESVDATKHGTSKIALKMVVRVSSWEDTKTTIDQALQQLFYEAGVGRNSEYQAEVTSLFSTPLFSG